MLRLQQRPRPTFATVILSSRTLSQKIRQHMKFDIDACGKKCATLGGILSWWSIE
ncbi:hypothetical protein NKG95_02820 [Mesorhizobium sp. M1423]|uniref:hypothetical protein n=1 Tax=unclassified Mesorhizobium TaxID=325217 RepID=UPI0025D4FB23|nr:hypothetical protein [Mesorhizobium sp.]